MADKNFNGIEDENENYKENIAKEQVYTMEKANIDNDLANDKAAEAQQAEEIKQPTNNVFKQMANKFKEIKADTDLKRMAKEQKSKEYGEKIQEAKRQRILAEQDKKFKDKLAYEQMTREERAARSKQKIGAFTDKLSRGLGSAGQNSFVNMAGNSVERQFGMGAGREIGGQSGSNMFSQEKMNMLLGKTNQTQQKFVAKGSQPQGQFSKSHLMGYLGSTGGPSTPAKYFPKSNIGGTASKASSYLGVGTGKKNYAGEFGVSAIGGKEATSRISLKKAAPIKISNPDYGVRVGSILGSMNMGGNKPVEKKPKGKIIDMVPQNDKEAQIKRLIGL